MKENSNPTVYSVSKREQKNNISFAATSLLKRIDCKETHKHDSLFHLHPHQLLTPTERSVQSGLVSIHDDMKDDSASEDDALGILHLAGINTTYTLSTQNIIHHGGALSSPRRDIMNCMDTQSMHFFQPSTSKPYSSSKGTGATKIERDQLTQREVFDIIRNIQDPEHPLALEQLNVVNYAHVQVIDRHPLLLPLDSEGQGQEQEQEQNHSIIDIRFTPTIPHCSMATLIGLCIRVKLIRSIPTRFKVNVRINPGTHASEVSINRQLNDKERVIAALENVHLLGVVNKCIANGMKAD